MPTCLFPFSSLCLQYAFFPSSSERPFIFPAYFLSVSSFGDTSWEAEEDTGSPEARDVLGRGTPVADISLRRRGVLVSQGMRLREELEEGGKGKGLAARRAGIGAVH